MADIYSRPKALDRFYAVKTLEQRMLLLAQSIEYVGTKLEEWGEPERAAGFKRAAEWIREELQR